MNGGTGDWRELLFSSAGRLARTPFLVTAAILLGVTGLYEGVVGPTLHWLTGWLVYPAVLFCGACVLSKRLHDRGRSGWWAALVLFALAVLWPYPHGFFDLLFLLVLVWAVVELGVMPGEQGANRYGPNPNRPQSSAV